MCLRVQRFKRAWFSYDGPSTSRDQLQDQHDDRRYQQQVNESTQRVAAHQANEPQNQEDHEDRPKHLYLPPEAMSFASKLSPVGFDPGSRWLFGWPSGLWNQGMPSEQGRNGCGASNFVRCGDLSGRGRWPAGNGDGMLLIIILIFLILGFGYGGYRVGPGWGYYGGGGISTILLIVLILLLLQVI